MLLSQISSLHLFSSLTIYLSILIHLFLHFVVLSISASLLVPRYLSFDRYCLLSITISNSRPPSLNLPHFRALSPLSQFHSASHLILARSSILFLLLTPLHISSSSILVYSSLSISLFSKAPLLSLISHPLSSHSISFAISILDKKSLLSLYFFPTLIVFTIRISNLF